MRDEPPMMDDTGSPVGRRHPKRFVNEEEGGLVKDAIDGLVAVNAAYLTRFRYTDGTKVIVRKDWTKQKVALISGGGAGHEPAHAGFVGKGLLTAAVSGEIFASPTVDAVLSAIVAVTGPKGCLLIVKNYTGDRLNFGLAAERAKTEYGLRVRMVVVADDVAVRDEIDASLQSSVGPGAVDGATANSVASSSGATGGGGTTKTYNNLKFSRARGLAGTLLVHKVAGAAAEDGQMLDTVFQEAQQIASAVKSMGVSMSTCTHPFSSEGRSLGDNKMELGLGIHGEPGLRKMDVLPVAEIVGIVIDEVMAALDPSCPEESSEETAEFSRGDAGNNGTKAIKQQTKPAIAVLLNNLGGVPALEMQTIAHEVLKNLGRRQILTVGPAALMTSLEMNGFSLSLAVCDEKMVQRLNAEVAGFTAWPGVVAGGSIYFRELDPIYLQGDDDVVLGGPGDGTDLGGMPPLYSTLASDAAAQAQADEPDDESQEATAERLAQPLPDDGLAALRVVRAVCEMLVENKESLNEMDSLVGDGDTGTQMALGANAVLAAIGQNRLHVTPYWKLCDGLSKLLRKNMGGSSGVLLSILFAAMSGGLKEFERENQHQNAANAKNTGPKPKLMFAFQKAAKTMSEIGGAKEGDRTMLDALLPASRVQVGDVPEMLFPAAKAGAESTQKLTTARAGRAQYLSGEDLEGNMDPGAFAAMLCFQAIQESML